MTTPPTPRDCRRVIREVNAFLRTFEPPLGDLPTERQPVAHILWGWWVWMSEQALIVAEAKKPRRVAALAPLVRSVGEHADLMMWLQAVGTPGVEALHARSQQDQRKMWRSFEEGTGHAPEAIPMPDEPPAAATDQEREARRTLDSVEQRMGMFVGGVPYYIYRLLSGLVHGSMQTARVYSPVDASGTGRSLQDPDPDAITGLVETQVQDCAVRCCQAAIVFRIEFEDASPQLTKKVLRWTEAMGMDDKLPLLKLIQQHQPSQTDIKNAAVQLLNSDFVAAAAVLGRIDAGEVFTADPGTEMAAIKRLRSAARDLVKVLST